MNNKMNSLTKCIVLGPNRSGTTYVHNLLMGHPEVSGIQEEIKIDPIFTKGISTFTYGNESIQDNSNGFVALFDALSFMNKKNNTKCGFIKIAILNPYYLEQFIHTYKVYLKDIKMVITLREDILAQYASQLRKDKTKIVTINNSNDSKNKDVKVKVNKNKLKKYVYNMIYMQKLILANLKDNVLFISYEKDILSDNFKLPEMLFSYIGVEQNINVSWQNQYKVSPAPEDYIYNYNNIREYYNTLIYRFKNKDVNDFKLNFQEKKMFRIKLLLKEIIKIIKE